MEEDMDTTSQAVEALLFLSSDPQAGAGPATAPNGSRRTDRSGAKAMPARQSDNGIERRAVKKERPGKAAARPIKRERSGEPKLELHPPAPLYNQPRDPTQSTSTASEGNPLVSPGSTPARILQQMAGGRTPQQTPNPAAKQSVKVQGIQHEVSASLLERAATEPQLLSFRRTGKSLNLCMLYDGTPYAGYFALNAKANEELNADSSSRSSDGSQAAIDGVDEDATAQAEEEEGGGRGRRRRAAHNYAQLADGSAATSMAASRPSLDLEGKEKLSKQKEIDSQQEWERMENEGPASGAVCALCHGPEDICRTMEIGARQNLPPRHLGKLILARPSLKRMPCWVHEQCALWSADLYHSDAQTRPLLASLGAALRRGLGMACSACHRKGATVSCVYPLCKKVFHVGCAVKSHCHMDASARWCTACPEHFAHAHHTLHTRLSQDALMGRSRKAMRRAISTVANTQRNQAHSDQQRSIMSDPGYALPPLFLNPGNPYGMQPFSSGLEGLNAANQGMLMGNLGNMGNVMQSLRMRMPPQMMPGMEALSGRMHPDAQLAAFNRGQGLPPGMQMPFDPMDVQSSSWLPGAMFQDSMHSGSMMDEDDDGLASGNRCSVCRVQRKGRCGTLSAPKSCLKRKKMEQAGLSVPPGPPKTTRVRQDMEH